MYQIIYDFFATYVFDPLATPASEWEIGGATISLGEWLNHTATIITLVALCLVAFRFVWWLVKLVANGLGNLGR